MPYGRSSFLLSATSPLTKEDLTQFPLRGLIELSFWYPGTSLLFKRVNISFRRMHEKRFRSKDPSFVDLRSLFLFKKWARRRFCLRFWNSSGAWFFIDLRRAAELITLLKLNMLSFSFEMRNFKELLTPTRTLLRLRLPILIMRKSVSVWRKS